MKALDSLGEKLISERAQAGEKEAFAEIYDFYVVKIFRFIYLKTNSKETAEDLTSEVFLKSWKYIKDGRENNRNEVKLDKISSFLYKIARNLVIDFYRKKQALTFEINKEISETVKDQSQDILAEISAKQEVEEMMKVLKQLKDEYQEVILLRYVEELSMREMVEITGKTEGALRVLLHRAVKSLEKALKSGRNVGNKGTYTI